MIPAAQNGRSVYIGTLTVRHGSDAKGVEPGDTLDALKYSAHPCAVCNVEHEVGVQGRTAAEADEDRFRPSAPKPPNRAVKQPPF